MATILIIDDRLSNREFLVALLRSEGHRILEASDGSQGLATLRAEHPTLVITDVLMPVMDGHEFVRQLRLDPATSKIPVLFYTPRYAEREARALASGGGVSYVLTKPAGPQEVLKVVGRALESVAEQEMRAEDTPPRRESDRWQLRLLTDRLSETTGDLKAANARLRALINIGLELESERDPDRLLQSVCGTARDLFGATYVTLGIVDLNDRTVQRCVTSGTDASGWLETGDPVSGILGTVIAERRALRGENPGGDPAGVKLPPLHPQVQAFLAAPVASPNRVYGWFCLVANDGRAFSEDDEDLVMALAGQIGRIYENSHFHAVAQERAAQLESEIVERKQAESALRRERDRAQRYLDAPQVILLALDLEGRITLANRYACSVLGWDADELLGRDWVDTCLPAGQRYAAEKRFNDLVGGDLSIVENTVRTRSGEERLIEWRNTLLRDDAGNVVGTLSSGSDITERRMLEEQYRQAQKMEAVGRLAGGVAHDFNNLLTAILGYCELLRADLDADDPRQADVAEIHKAGTAAARLTHQLLAFSRRQIIEPTLLDLNVVVAGMQGMLGRLIGEDVKVVVSLPPGLAPVLADRGQVEQIVMNLAVNARDAMPRGGTLTIETASVELDEHYAATHPDVTPGPYVVMTVSDTGSGMTPEVQARLFEPFFTTKEPGKGTGLGLATVYGIAAQSGGSVGVDSEVGRGTSFKVYFPRADTAEMVVEAPPPRARPHTGARHTVLVVEDAEGLGALARRLLERLDYRVLIAANADEAVELFKANPSVDVLLTDVVMPGASGPELTRQLVERRPGLKVVYMSGYTEEAIVRHGVLNPGITLLHKPFTSETLDRKLREALDR